MAQTMPDGAPNLAMEQLIERSYSNSQIANPKGQLLEKMRLSGEIRLKVELTNGWDVDRKVIVN